jgi:hypothetical protein
VKRFSQLAAGSLVGLVLLGVSAAACEEKRPPVRERPPPPPASPSAMAERLKIDAAALDLPVDPATPAGDLKTEVALFTTLEACARDHAQLDALVGDAIRSIGYDAILRDACRSLEALKDKNIEKCKPIESSPLRTRCELVFAAVTAAPDLCPLQSSVSPAQGRQALCVAVASRDPRLCAAAAGYPERTSCEALLGHSKTPCKALPGADRQRCEHDVDRMQSVIEVPKPSTPFKTPTFALDLQGVTDSAPPQDPHVEFPRDVARGVVVVQEGGKLHVEVGMAMRDAGTLFAPSPSQRTRMSFTASVPATLGQGTLDRLELEVPGRAVHVVPSARCDCRVRFLALSPVRGADAQLEVDGTIGVPPNAFKMVARISTFVRDVVKKEDPFDKRK